VTILDINPNSNLGDICLNLQQQEALRYLILEQMKASCYIGIIIGLAFGALFLYLIMRFERGNTIS
jgi:hypothetical protein